MDKKGELPLLFSWYFRTFAAVMIVANMNLHEVYADLMGEMGKLDWKPLVRFFGQSSVYSQT